MTLRLSLEQTEKPRAAAARDDFPMQAAALQAIDNYVEDLTQRRDQMIDQSFGDHAELFDRLVDA